MRILHVIHTPRYSGAEMLVASLTKSHLVMGHASFVVSINPSEEDFKSLVEQQKQDGIEWAIPAQPLGKFSRVAFINKTAKGFNPDVTFAHSVIPAAYARLAGAKNVVTVLHDASETDYSSTYFRFSEKFLQYMSAGVIAVSSVARQHYAENFSYPRVQHIPNGISVADHKRTLLQRETVRNNLGLASTDLVAIQIGRINSIKQQHLSLKAIIPIIRSNRSVHFVMAGLVEDAAYLEDLKRTTRTGGVEDKVHFLGPRKDVADLLSAADLFLMPSLREAHSVAMIEALAASLPIIASPIPSFQYTSGFEGVSLLPPENVEEFSSMIRVVLNQPKRYVRDLHGFDIKDTALAYIDFATQCTS